MKARAHVIELRLVEAEPGFPPRYTASVMFRGDVVGSAAVNVSPDLYARLQVVLSKGERPELEVELKFEGR